MTETATSHSPEVRERAVRLVLHDAGEHRTQSAAICAVAAKIGCTKETRRTRARQAERDARQRAALTGAGRERIRWLAKGLREPRQANEIVPKASAHLAQAGLDRRSGT